MLWIELCMLRATCTGTDAHFGCQFVVDSSGSAVVICCARKMHWKRSTTDEILYRGCVQFAPVQGLR
jgi:hypothetical protein